MMQLMLADAERDGPRIMVGSGGLTALVGWPIADHTAALIDRMGGDSRGHSARTLTPDDLTSPSLVLTATRAQRSRLVQMLPRVVQHTFTIRQVGHVLSAAYPDGPRSFPPHASPEARLGKVAELVHVHAGALVGLDEESDIADPFAKREPAHAHAAGRMLPALNLLASWLGGTPVDIPPKLQAAGAVVERSRWRRSHAV